MGDKGKDLFLAKRRILAMLPFIVINFGLSVVMVVFGALASNRIETIKEDYRIKIVNSTHTFNIISSNSICDRYKNYYTNDENFTNFTNFFGVDSKFETLYDGTLYLFGYSIVSVTYLTSLLIAIIILACCYIKSDDIIKQNKYNRPNNKHICTLIFMIIKLGLFLHLYIKIIQHLVRTIKSYNSKFFKNVYDFHDICIDNKSKFKEKYCYCWSFQNHLNMLYLFIFLFFIVDIIAMILTVLSQFYNVWQCLLSYITCGKYEYISVESINQSFFDEKEKRDEDDDSIPVYGEINNS